MQEQDSHNQHLPDMVQGAVKALVESILAEPRTQHLNRVFLPSRPEIIQIVERLRQIVYPGYFGPAGLTRENIAERLGEMLREVNGKLFEQVRCCLRYRKQIPSGESDTDACHECDAEAAEILRKFFDGLPSVRAILATDVQAAFDSDPAATSTDETIFCYPGLLAITVQRLAHEFYRLGVPLLPRIMTEYAHSVTGIDIHPGAELGESFFIDHGTGVVIGETTRIGRNVKVYQGVTLGALAPHFGQLLRGQKRHPTIEENVTIYAGATILGGETVIGKGSVIGGNVFITSSVPPQNQVIAEPPKLTYRDKRKKGKADHSGDFQI
jgi:serine O-acetyltransferase